MKTLFISLKVFFLLSLLTGVIYPLLITGIAQLFFPTQANGSLVLKDLRPVGSELIGQLFDTTIYFSSRPSSIAYNPLPSGGSNLGLTSHRLDSLFRSRSNKFITDNKLSAGTVLPSEMLLASGSGLDPHISPGAALMQVERISSARHFTPVQRSRLERLVLKRVEPRQMMILGEPRVNVLLLNLELDKIK